MLSRITKFLKTVLIDESTGVSANVNSVGSVSATITDPTTGNQAEVVESALNVNVDYQIIDSLDLYLYRIDATLTITTSAAIDDEVINVVSSVGAVVGEAITLYEDDRIFQSLITATTATTVSLASPLDYAFTSSATVECGPWLLNVDGSVTPQEFIIKAPPDKGIEVHSFRSSMLDSSDMDDGLFGGLTALTNGVIMRYVNGKVRQLALFINNLGFFEEGYTKTYSSKAPSGQYGVTFERSIPYVNGVVVLIEAGGSGILKVIVRDDLTALDQFTFTIHGHIQT